jgi:hypothetical protein
MSKKVLLFLISQIEQQIVVIDNGTPEEIADASDAVSNLVAMLREAIG